MTNILVVDEERSIRQAIKFELENAGYLVIDVANFSEAHCAYNAFKCGLVISDISNEKNSGKYLFERFKDVPFIALSSFSGSRTSQLAKAKLKDRFFEKPFLMSQLVSKVNETINNQYNFANIV